MIKIRYGDIPSEIPECVACIGFFDSLHKGHQQLISRCLKEAKTTGLVPALICFDKDPLEVITGEAQMHILNDQERISHIHSLGIDLILMFAFDEKLMNLAPLDFIHDYLEKMKIRKLICGFDFRFGYQGKGDTAVLQRQGSFETIVIPEIDYYHTKISSSRIKKEITRGNLRLAEKLLGYRYHLDAEVIKCEKTGGNCVLYAECTDPYKILPPNGIYNNDLELKDGIWKIISADKKEIKDRIRVEP